MQIQMLTNDILFELNEPVLREASAPKKLFGIKCRVRNWGFLPCA